MCTLYIKYPKLSNMFERSCMFNLLFKLLYLILNMYDIRFIM